MLELSFKLVESGPSQELMIVVDGKTEDKSNVVHAVAMWRGGGEDRAVQGKIWGKVTRCGPGEDADQVESNHILCGIMTWCGVSDINYAARNKRRTYGWLSRRKAVALVKASKSCVSSRSSYWMLKDGMRLRPSYVVSSPDKRRHERRCHVFSSTLGRFYA